MTCALVLAVAWGTVAGCSHGGDGQLEPTPTVVRTELVASPAPEPPSGAQECRGLERLEQRYAGYAPRVGPEVNVGYLLLEMQHVDQLVRRFCGDTFAIGDLVSEADRGCSERCSALVEAIDRANAAAASVVLEQMGWPTQPSFTEHEEEAVWLLLQHADHDRALQRQALKGLEVGLQGQHGERTGRYYAYLHDRLAVADGKPQRFGTQGRCVAVHDWEPWPVADAEQLDARRAAMGLEPAQEYYEECDKVLCRRAGEGGLE